MRTTLLTFLLCFSGHASYLFGEDPTPIDEVNITYSRAFHRTIELDLRKDDSGRYEVSGTTIPKADDQTPHPLGQPIEPRTLSASELSDLVAFIDDPGIRNAFISIPKHPAIEGTDGSTLELTAARGRFSVTFQSENILVDQQQSEAERRLQSVVFNLFDKSGIRLRTSPSYKDMIVPKAEIDTANWRMVAESLMKLRDVENEKVQLRIFATGKIDESPRKPFVLKEYTVPKILDEVGRQYGVEWSIVGHTVVFGPHRDLQRFLAFAKTVKPVDSQFRRFNFPKIILGQATIREVVAFTNRKFRDYEAELHPLNLATTDTTDRQVNFCGEDVSVAELLFLISTDAGMDWDKLFTIVP